MHALHVLMHEHILTNVWDQKLDECNVHTGPKKEHMFACNYEKGKEQI